VAQLEETYGMMVDSPDRARMALGSFSPRRRCLENQAFVLSQSQVASGRQPW
jgi:hypothetical protein